jgi:hypothetical protein
MAMTKIKSLLMYQNPLESITDLHSIGAQDFIERYAFSMKPSVSR